MSVMLDFSIVIPVFNREDLTQQCLSTLLPTLAGAGTGEVIVVDNGSEPATAAVLAAHPWVRVIRNERNLGFAAACNQGTRAAQGRFVVHLNNDTVGRDGWLAAMLRVFAEEENVGVVGARLLFPDGTLQHAGVAAAPTRLGPEGFGPYHLMWKWPGNSPAAMHRTDFDVVTGACLVMRRDVYLELGGFDEIYWNGYEDVDLCYKARARGLRVVYEPSAVLIHYESQSGIQRKRRVLHNIRELAARWRDTVIPDHNRWAERLRYVRRDQFVSGVGAVSLPRATLLVHGPQPADPDAWLARARGARYPIAHVVWCADGRAPLAVDTSADPRAALAQQMTVRGDRYLAIVDTRSRLAPDWLNDLIDTIEYASDICAATVLTHEEAVVRSMPLTVDARCVLLSLRNFPQHLAADPTYANLGGMVAALTADAVALGRSVRAARRPVAELGPDEPDGVFEQRHGTAIAHARRPDDARLEALSAPDSSAMQLAIVMVTRNLSDEAANAIRSIREGTRIAYDLIVVDNGSTKVQHEMLSSIPNVKLITCSADIGLAGARNLGATYATGTHLTFLDDDVVVGPDALEILISAFRSDPALGITAPQTNNGTPLQMNGRPNYADVQGLLAFARARREDFGGSRIVVETVAGFCMCVSRTAWDVVGGFDPRFAAGTFGATDLCLRIGAAGYAVAICEDAYVHHNGGQAMRANNRSYAHDAQANWATLARVHALPAQMPKDTTDAFRTIVRAGFDATRHHIARAKQPT